MMIGLPNENYAYSIPVTFTLDARMETYVNPYHFDYHF